MDNASYWFCESNNLFLVEGLYDNVNRMFLNALDTTKRLSMFKETPESLNAGVAVDKGGGLVGIPITGHGFDVDGGDYVRIQDSINYDDEYTTHIDTTVDEVVITATYVAETFLGTEEMFHGVAGGTNITGTYVADTDGNWNFIIPAAADLRDGDSYIVFVTLTDGASTLTIKEKRKAIFFPRDTYS